MKDECTDRHRAIQMRLAGQSVDHICQALQRSRQWVHSWWGRYLAYGPDGLFDLTHANHQGMDEVLAFLVERWKTLGRPRYVQFDNARELAGGGKAARYLSRVIRLRLYLGVEPVFIPPAQPRYNDRPHQGQNSMACRPTNMRPANQTCSSC